MNAMLQSTARGVFAALERLRVWLDPLSRRLLGPTLTDAEAQAAGTPIEGATPVLALEAHVEPASSGDGS